MLKFKNIFTFLSIIALLCLIQPFSHVSYAETTALVPHSWDPGLYATSSQYNDTAHSWGRRSTSGSWGTNGVNYQSGSTTNWRASSAGSLSVVLNGTYCPNGKCSYGAGTGYKGLVQFWNDPGNFIAFGLIHDPGVSPNGTTLMIEGAAGGRPVGGYWPKDAITGTSHLFKLSWTGNSITLSIDNNVTLGPYPVSTSNPSVSFLAAGRNTGDISDTTFSGINFSAGATSVPDVIQEPSSAPYFTYSANVTAGGSGSGRSAFINAHDGNGGPNAVAIGIQSDTGSPESRGTPWYMWERVQNGQFTYQYIKPASNNGEKITLKWWKNEQVAIFYVNDLAISNFSLNLNPILGFNAEGNARLNGDVLNSTINNTQIAFGGGCTTRCNFVNSWALPPSSNTYGLQATHTNGLTQGGNFTISGTVTGLPAGGNWDTNQVSGIAVLNQN